MYNKTLAINGSNGFLGKSICNYLAQKYTILKISRKDYLNPEALALILKDADVVINLAGARISFFPTQSYKKEMVESRVQTTKLLVEALNLLEKKPELFISFSAIGIYNYTGVHDESSIDFANDFLAKLCKQWEQSAIDGNSLINNTLIARIGLVLSRYDGMLAKMLTPFKLGFGTIIGDGTQPVSFIHLDDFLRARWRADRSARGQMGAVRKFDLQRHQNSGAGRDFLHG